MLTYGEENAFSTSIECIFSFHIIHLDDQTFKIFNINEVNYYSLKKKPSFQLFFLRVCSFGHVHVGTAAWIYLGCKGHRNFKYVNIVKLERSIYFTDLAIGVLIIWTKL